MAKQKKKEIDLAVIDLTLNRKTLKETLGLPIPRLVITHQGEAKAILKGIHPEWEVREWIRKGG